MDVFGTPPGLMTDRERVTVLYMILESLDAHLYWAIEDSGTNMDDLAKVIRQLDVLSFR